ncbi:hypothetical protein [Dickeya zeae]|uniref:hypothetical protein n=1 Tax=Dickeya zeae TaxID=204042 RepID=UPI0013150D6B|nr:hypothetical protein [Dickeya zeae]UJR59194.1 hypothetical protein HJ580_14010 [Dickeya zeae]
MKMPEWVLQPELLGYSSWCKALLNRGVPAPDRPPTTRDSLAVIGIETGVLIILIEKTIQYEMIDIFLISIQCY